MKKILLITSIILALILAGCSGQSTSTQETAETENVPTTEVSEVAEDSTDAETSEIAQTPKTDILFVRNATMKITYGGKTFLADPMLSEKETLPGFLTPDKLANPTAPMPVATEDLLEGVEAVIVTHSHIPAEDIDAGPSDHFDTAAIEAIDKDMPIFIQPFDVAGIERIGFNNVTAIEDTLEIDDVSVTRFEGVHADVDALLPLVGDSSGYVLEAEGYPRILWTGDVLLTDEIKAEILRHQPDIIIAHTGGARLPIDAEGNVSKLVMDAEDAIEIAKLAPEATVIAIHMESLDHCPVTRDELREKAAAAGISADRLLIPADGDLLSF